jgi:membrane peptidoglycan carboxypeptidase
MPTIPHVIRMRRRRHQAAGHSLVQRLGRIGMSCSLVLSMLVALSLAGLTAAYANLTYDLPPPETLLALLEPPEGLLLQPTRIYDRTGEHLILTLENPVTDGRQYLPLDKTIHSAQFYTAGSADKLDFQPSVRPNSPPSLPVNLAAATIASADPAFWNHPGFSWQGLRQGSHPTLAQRLVSDLLLWDEPPGIRRALRERLLAAQVTAYFGREKVLEWYLNSANYGHLAYGAEAAARLYLGKAASELNLVEAAVLAAASEAPALNPLDAPQAAREHQNKILQAMLIQDYITPDQFLLATQKNPEFARPEESETNLAPAFTQLALEQLEQYINPDRLRRGGLKIITTLNYELQYQAECAVATQLAYLANLEQGTAPEIGDPLCLTARLLPTFTSQDLRSSDELAANLVGLDPATGQILAMVGNTAPGLDPAHLPGHPHGSLLTPFIYLTAFSRGLSPATMVWDIPTGFLDTPTAISNSTDTLLGPMRLRTALANDYLRPAAQIMNQMGQENVWRTAQQLGVTSLEPPTGRLIEDLLLEGSEVTLLEISQAFGVLANQGRLAGQILPSDGPTNGSNQLKPVAVLKVTDALGKNWLECSELFDQCQLSSRPVTSPQLAYLMTHILSDETARWPSLGHPNLLEIGRPAGVKIGRIREESDAWVIGYTPRLVIGVWLGAGAESKPGLASPDWAAGLWHAVIRYASRDHPPEGWLPPSGISFLEVCDPSGLLPTENCPGIVTEVFASGSEPVQKDNLFRAYRINRETGRLATVFTPPELVEERIYMVAPPEAAAWIQATGLPAPPEDYDVILAPPPSSPDAQITSPAMFASLKGQVVIYGAAGGEDFSFYRLQVGQGLNPLAWLQIGEDAYRSVTNGKLALWDTRDLNGLYALQLLVVSQDQQVQTVTLQVTVDNQPPQVFVRYPAEGQRFSHSPESQLTLQAEASDDLELAMVEFYLDNQLVKKLTEPPYVVPWQTKPGKHTLRVRAIDRAGNTSEASATFIIER